MNIQNVNDVAFKKYGKVIKGLPCEDIIEVMKSLDAPSDVVYVPSHALLEGCSSAGKIKNSLYGGMPIQIGYCNGHNKKLNALEYHRDSEINIAATDLVLIIGSEQDIEEDMTYDTSKAEVFFVPQGTVIEVFATTLHYAPCHVNEEGFKCVVVLPEGTNTELDKESNIEEDRLLFAKNKWLIAHEEAGLEKDGAFIGLKGKNITID